MESADAHGAASRLIVTSCEGCNSRDLGNMCKQKVLELQDRGSGISS